MDVRAGRSNIAGMSYVVRHKSTGRYLQGRDEWTNHLESALQFNSGLNLVKFVEGGVHEPQERLEVVMLPTQTVAA
jgi:hypothetical protein